MNFIKGCQVCQENKYSTLSPVGLLSPLLISIQIWSNISLDFIKGFLSSKRFNSVLVVVDHLSKYSHFIPLTHPYSAKTVVEAFIREIVKLHGYLAIIVLDRDKIFLSKFWSKLFKLQGISLHKSTTYYPQTDG